MNDKVTVVMPIAGYNLQWVDQSIESCKGFADELILVLDVKAGAELQKFHDIKHVSNIIVVKQPGLAMALNIGIVAAKNNWISFQCSDDYYDATGAAIIKHEMKKWVKDDPTDSFRIVGGQTHSFGMLGDNVWPLGGNIFNLENECCITSPALFTKDLWWCVGGYSDVRYLDWHFWKKCMRMPSVGYQFFPVIMNHYRAWEGTISNRYNYRADLGHEWGDGPKER